MCKHCRKKNDNYIQQSLFTSFITKSKRAKHHDPGAPSTTTASDDHTSPDEPLQVELYCVGLAVFGVQWIERDYLRCTHERKFRQLASLFLFHRSNMIVTCKNLRSRRENRLMRAKQSLPWKMKVISSKKTRCYSARAAENLCRSGPEFLHLGGTLEHAPSSNA